MTRRRLCIYVKLCDETRNLARKVYAYSNLSILYYARQGLTEAIKTSDIDNMKEVIKEILIQNQERNLSKGLRARNTGLSLDLEKYRLLLALDA